MVSKVLTITNAVGLHARPASLFVQTAGKYRAKIDVIVDDARFNAKSIMGIMSGGITQGTSITIEVEGEDEQDALDALTALVESKFGEK